MMAFASFSSEKRKGATANFKKKTTTKSSINLYFDEPYRKRLRINSQVKEYLSHDQHDGKPSLQSHKKSEKTGK